MMRIFLCVLFYVLFCSTWSRGQQVGSRLDSIQFLIGDQTRLILEGYFTAPIDDISFSQTSIDSSQAIEFINQSSIYKEVDGNRTKYTREFLIAFFDTGAYYVPQVPIIITSAGRFDTFYTAPIPIQVRPIAVDSLVMMAIKPIILEKRKWTDFWPVAAVILGLALLIYFIIQSKRRRKILAQTAVIETPKSPYELAMMALEQLEELDYVNQNKIKEHFSQLSIILRSYIEQQFKFPALESTTREIGYGLDTAKFGADLKTDVLEYLQKIDLIKFAKVEPQPDDIYSSLVTAKNQIDQMEELVASSIAPSLGNKNALV
jgi:hypothetical protein